MGLPRGIPGAPLARQCFSSELVPSLVGGSGACEDVLQRTQRGSKEKRKALFSPSNCSLTWLVPGGGQLQVDLILSSLLCKTQEWMASFPS